MDQVKTFRCFDIFDKKKGFAAKKLQSMIYLIDLPEDILMQILTRPYRTCSAMDVLAFHSVDTHHRQHVLKALSSYFKQYEDIRYNYIPNSLANDLKHLASNLPRQRRTRNFWERIAPLIKVLDIDFIQIWWIMRNSTQLIKDNR